MILQRCIVIGFQLAIVIMLVWRWAARVRRLRAGPALACPACHYPIAGLIVARCPECGQSVSVDGIIEATRLRGRRELLVAVTIWPAALAVFGWIIASTLLEIHRIIKIGPTAFVPGYSLWSDLNAVDALIVVGVLFGFGTLALITVVVMRRALAVQLERTIREARGLGHSLAVSVSPTSV